MTRDELKLAIAKALALAEGAKWDAANFNETLNGESPSDMRDAYEGQAQTALTAIESAGVALVPGDDWIVSRVRQALIDAAYSSSQAGFREKASGLFAAETFATVTINEAIAASPYRSAP
jgi:hypothetical protein